MRSIIFRMTEDLFKEALHIPLDCQITSISFNNWPPEIIFDVDIPGVIEEGQSLRPIEVTPIVQYEPEKYIWDWNLPK